nr:protein GPR15L isoform X1 [Macaca nemestrina]
MQVTSRAVGVRVQRATAWQEVRQSQRCQQAASRLHDQGEAQKSKAVLSLSLGALGGLWRTGPSPGGLWAPSSLHRGSRPGQAFTGVAQPRWKSQAAGACVGQADLQGEAVEPESDSLTPTWGSCLDSAAPVPSLRRLRRSQLHLLLWDHGPWGPRPAPEPPCLSQLPRGCSAVMQGKDRGKKQDRSSRRPSSGDVDILFFQTGITPSWPGTSCETLQTMQA